MRWSRWVSSVLRAVCVAVGCIVCGVGIGGPVPLTFVGALLLIALPVPHALRARRMMREHRPLAGIDAVATAVVLTCPSLFFVTLRSVDVAWFGLVPVLLAAALTVSVAVSRELGPVAQRDVAG